MYDMEQIIKLRNDLTELEKDSNLQQAYLLDMFPDWEALEDEDRRVRIEIGLKLLGIIIWQAGENVKGEAENGRLREAIANVRKLCQTAVKECTLKEGNITDTTVLVIEKYLGDLLDEYDSPAAEN